MRTHFTGFVLLASLLGCPGEDSKPTGGQTGEDVDNCGDDCDADQDGFSIAAGDCDDNDGNVNPGATETCNGIDDNCDEVTDEGVEQTFYQDFDEDGFGNGDIGQVACEPPEGYISNGSDCDDADDAAFPGATEVCDSVDNDCNGEIDDGVTTTYYADADADTFGDPNTVEYACTAPTGYVEDGTDCNDSTSRSRPGGEEVCDELDNDCDGNVDENVTTTYYVDADGDTYGDPYMTQDACSVPTGYSESGDDCDDGVNAINPGATETCNLADDDCDSVIDEDDAADAITWFQDADTDGFGNASATYRACEVPSGYVSDDTDCDDTRALTNPAASEYCNTYDDDCDGTTDEDSALDALTWYLDADSDTYGNASVTDVACTQPSGYVGNATDCNDGTSRANPGASEYCDYIDNDCDGTTDEDSALDASTWYQDADSDSYGNASVVDVECRQPSGYVSNSSDCLDTRAASYPGAPEYCNTYDDDCDGTVDEDAALDASTWYRDSDSDSYGDSSVSYDSCSAPTGYVSDDTDCDDARSATNPGATEYCNTIDDDCDGTTDEDSAADAVTYYQDLDSDGYGNVSVTDVACTRPSGYVTNDDDCIDSSSISYPGASEIGDSRDHDCDGPGDDNPTDGTTYYLDSDADGFGDPSSTDSECSLPSGYAENAYDCNDGDATEPQVADVASGSSAGTGSLSRPFDSIQDAIDNALECVVVYQGTYEEQIDLDGKSIDVWGVDGEDYTLIDANLTTCTTSDPTSCGSTVTIDSNTGASPTIHGFTITGGTGTASSTSASTSCADSSASHSGRNTCTVYTYSYMGGGLYISGDDPSFYDVIVRDNILPEFEQTSVGSFTQYWMYSYGGGVYLANSAATFEDTIVEGNFADEGGGFFAGSGSILTFSQGYVSENDAADGAGLAVAGGTTTLTNAIVSCNDATTDGGGLFTETSGSNVFTNAVFYNNTSSTSGTSRGSEAYIGSSTTFYLYNSIAQTATSVYAIYGGGGTGTQSYNNVYNTPGSAYGGSLSAGAGAISSGSNFTSASCDGNPYNDDFSLRSSSSSLNAGNSSSAYNDADGTRNDQGAYGGPGGSW